MKPPEEIKQELLRQWLTKADQDLTAAKILLQSGSHVLGITAFHAQQAAEKYLKAFLVWKQIDFPKTHNIGTLLVLISGVDDELASKLMSARVLSDYAVENRYPGDIPELGNEEASTAIKLAETVREGILLAVRDVA
jgi:HEPN domain-containing protein